MDLAAEWLEAEAWARDQHLDGIIDGAGDGSSFRERLRRAVARGMDRGHTTPQPSQFWRDLTSRLHPSKPGCNEKKVLLNRILSRAGPVEMIVALKEALIAQRGVSTRDEEAGFLRTLATKAPPDLKQLLTAIDAYEDFARAITDAFDGLRHCATIRGRAPVEAQDFASVEATKVALAALARSLQRIHSHPTLLEWERERKELAQAVELFDGVRNASNSFDAVLK